MNTENRRSRGQEKKTSRRISSSHPLRNSQTSIPCPCYRAILFCKENYKILLLHSGVPNVFRFSLFFVLFLVLVFWYRVFMRIVSRSFCLYSFFKRSGVESCCRVVFSRLSELRAASGHVHGARAHRRRRKQASSRGQHGRLESL